MLDERFRTKANTELFRNRIKQVTFLPLKRKYKWLIRYENWRKNLLL
ncbi:hypothetical protein HYE24_00865 [Mycoplasmopsis bovis]|nr:hypothetical protein [Mycoplasmopsis bovis]QQH23617.1 hypothetical protein HYE24_00865 [Mycoplasmopsis bovis]